MTGKEMFKDFIKKFEKMFSPYELERMREISRMRSAKYEVRTVRPGEVCKVFPTSTDSTVRMIFAIDPDGNFHRGMSGSYDTAINDGAALGHAGSMIEGSSVIVIDRDKGYFRFAKVIAFVCVSPSPESPRQLG